MSQSRGKHPIHTGAHVLEAFLSPSYTSLARSYTYSCRQHYQKQCPIDEKNVPDNWLSHVWSRSPNGCKNNIIIMPGHTSRVLQQQRGKAPAVPSSMPCSASHMQANPHVSASLCNGVRI